MTIRVRFALLLALIFGGLLFALAGLRALAAAERDNILAADRQSRSQMLTHWINTASRELAALTNDIAASDDFATSVQREDTAAARRLLGSDTAQPAIGALWVVRADGATIFRLPSRPDMPTAPPLTRGELARLLAETPSPRFFSEANGHILELCARPARPLGANHWVVVARPWDEPLLRSLSSLTESSVSLRPAHELVRAQDAPDQLVLVRPLTDAAGRILRVLRMDYALPEAERVLRTDWRQTLLFVAFGLLLLLAVSLAVRAWVLRPLHVIGAGLASPTGAPALPLATARDEFGKVAQLVVSAAEQRVALEREVAERTRTQEALAHSEATLRGHIADRTRLGRDLHDGVIQSLYAAGMNLAGVRAQLAPEQAAAAARLEQTTNVLNESIRDLRNFIDGLEPESLKRQSFSQAVGDLVDAMSSMQPFQARIELEENIAARLSLSQQVHALQITREAISNALRHGQANRIEIALRHRSGLAELKIIDNGSGFDASSASSQGRGLLNFVQRARELGATLAVESHPGCGTIVNLTFSLP
ncbi:MAG: hypothetical protein JNL39_15840 [Opitutaceae bacterium]|nr:hypothetical protein [Opitutaceae bacterium]